MNKAISYIRFSSGKQAKGSSYERQQAMLTEWLEREANQQYELSEARYQDLGVSGWSGKHTENGFGKLLQAVEAGVIGNGDAILVEAIDRTGRMDTADMLDLLIPILKAGVSIVTLDDGNTYNRESINGSHIYMLSAKIQAANQYSEALSRRIKASHASKKQKAVNDGAVPKRRVPVWLNSDGTMREDVAPFIKQAFEDYASGLGERRIYERIHKQHPLLEKMAPASIKRWFSNKTAIGYWGEIPNIYPCVVEPDLFYRVQARLQDVYKPKSAPTKHTLPGLVFCAACESRFVVRKFKNSPAVMDCGLRARKGKDACSNNRSLPVAVLQYIYQMSITEHADKALEGLYLTESQKRDIVIDGKIIEIGKQIARVVKAITIMEDDSPELTTELQQLQAERKKLQNEKEGLTYGDVSTRDKLKNITAFMKDPMKANAMLQGVGYRLECDVSGNITTPIGLFVYQGWDKKEDVYKLVNTQQRVLSLPVPREDKAVDTTRMSDTITKNIIRGLASKK